MKFNVRFCAGILVLAISTFATARLDASEPAKVRALYFRDDTPVELAPAPSAPPGMKVQALADLPLILSNGVAVTAGGFTFVFEREGMYRICDLVSKTTANVILDRGDLWRLTGHLSRLQVHGWRHDKEELNRWTVRARRGRLSISCGNVVQFVAHHLKARGRRTRTVQLVTLEKHNGYDDGHVLMEVFDPAEKRWLLYDPDLKCRFRRNGRWLDSIETVALYRGGGRAELVFLAPPAIDAYAEEGADKAAAQFSLLFETTFRDPAARQQWYRRMFQVATVKD